MAVEDFGGKVQGAPIEIISADHQNKPDIASNIARQWYDTEQVDAIMELTTSSVALAVQGIVQGKEEDRHRHRRGDDGPDRQAVLALRLPLGLRHPCAGGRHRRRAGAAGRRQLVLPHRRLCLRLFARRSRPPSSSRSQRRQGAGRGAPSRSATTDYSSFLLQAQSSGAKVIGLANAGLDTSNAIKQAAEFGIVAGRPAPGGASVHAGRSAWPRPRGGARPDADRRLLLGSRRREPRLRQALLRAHQPHAEHDPGRHLFGGDAVSEGDRQGRHRRDRGGRQAAA